MERVTGIDGVFQRARQAASLRDWYAEHLGIDTSDWGAKPFEWTPGGSTTWAIFDHDTEYFGRPEQAFMVNFPSPISTRCWPSCARLESK